MSDKKAHTCIPCGLHQPKRNNYFDGKLLLARDFEDEQAYHVGKRQLLNAQLHGQGTVCGLKVVEHPSPDCRDRFVVLEPGLALDCCGQEIIVPEKTLIRIEDLVGELEEPLIGYEDLFIAVCRCDQPGELAPVILAECEGNGGMAPGRICEGFEIKAYARKTGSVRPVEHALTPGLHWRHTLNLHQQSPRGLAIDEDQAFVYVATKTADPVAKNDGRVYVYKRENHDLVTALNGPQKPSDLKVSPIGDQVYVAGIWSGKANAIGVYDKSEIRTVSDPLGRIKLDGPARLAVSPRSGALYALVLKTGQVFGWSQEAIDAWIDAGAPVNAPPTRVGPVETGVKPADPLAPAFRGAEMFEISADGKQILVANAGAKQTGAILVIDTATLFAQGGANAVITPDLNLLAAAERVIAVKWSSDSELIFALTQGADGAANTTFRRLGLSRDAAKFVQRGRGARWLASPLDLSVSPGERWAYVLQNSSDGAPEIVSASIEAAMAPGDTPATDALVGEVLDLAGTGRFAQLSARGDTLFAACDDQNPETNPDRGLIAIIDIDETDCGEIFDGMIDGCAACEADTECVILAHIPGYVTASKPNIRDAGKAAEGEVEIDNLTYRPLAPSNAVLKEVVDCILAQGVAEGPPRSARRSW